MTKKKQQNTWIIIGIIAVVLLFMFYSGGKKESDEKDEETTEETTDEGIISVEFQDDNGNTLSSARTFSTVTGTSGTVMGASTMRLTITAINTGNESLICEIVSSSPSQFSSALTLTPKIIPSTAPKKSSWTSNLIPLSQFEGVTQPITFSVTIRCKYTIGTRTFVLEDKTGALPLTITPDVVNAGFEVGIGAGGLEQEYCGDKICQSYNLETANNCPSDCAFVTTVKFRTTDLDYTSGSAIAFNTNSCGNTLTAYGAKGITSSTATSCAGYLNNVIMVVPCSYNDRICKLGTRGQSNTTYVCWLSSTGGTIGREYSVSDSDASKVSTSQVSFDSDKEVAC